MAEFWDKRYGQEEFAYGKEPNEYIKEKLTLLPPGKILFPGEGEGRNAVHAAGLGWDVYAYDQSVKGMEKANGLASSKEVSIDYRICSFMEESYLPGEFDAIGLIYVHPEEQFKKIIHKRFDDYIKVGGHIIFEAFSKEHKEMKSTSGTAGGPSDIGRLYSVDEIKESFANYEIIELKKDIITLNEGFGHVGKSHVVRFFGRKTHDRLS